jgi:hypothetical protein
MTAGVPFQFEIRASGAPARQHSAARNARHIWISEGRRRVAQGRIRASVA